MSRMVLRTIAGFQRRRWWSPRRQRGPGRWWPWSPRPRGESGSSASSASRMASLIWSQILSGWPAVTDSEVNRRRGFAEVTVLLYLGSCRAHWRQDMECHTVAVGAAASAGGQPLRNEMHDGVGHLTLAAAGSARGWHRRRARISTWLVSWPKTRSLPESPGPTSLTTRRSQPLRSSFACAYVRASASVVACFGGKTDNELLLVLGGPVGHHLGQDVGVADQRDDGVGQRCRAF